MTRLRQRLVCTLDGIALRLFMRLIAATSPRAMSDAHYEIRRGKDGWELSLAYIDERGECVSLEAQSESAATIAHLVMDRIESSR